MADTTAQGRINALANPTRFLELAGRILPWLGGAALLVTLAGLAMGFAAPEDYQQGSTVRIMYIHVPFAWISMMCYTLMAVAALGTLVWKHPLADVALKAAAPIGAVFTALALATGSIWGRPMWGTWWVWDGRLTSMLVLLFLYFGYIALTGALAREGASTRIAAIFGLVGAINIPIINRSVVWWNSLHQPPSLTMGNSAIDPVYLYPLAGSTLGFSLLFGAVVLMRMRTILADAQAEARLRRKAMAVEEIF